MYVCFFREVKSRCYIDIQYGSKLFPQRSGDRCLGTIPSVTRTGSASSVFPAEPQIKSPQRPIMLSIVLTCTIPVLCRSFTHLSATYGYTRLPGPSIVKRNEPLPLEIIVHKDADSPAWMFLSAYKSQLLNKLELDPKILLALTPKSG